MDRGGSRRHDHGQQNGRVLHDRRGSTAPSAVTIFVPTIRPRRTRSTRFLGLFVFTKEQLSMKLTDQLTNYVNAAFAGIWIETREADEAEREIVQHARDKKWKVAVWDVANGLRVPGAASGTPESGAGDPLAALRALP